MCTNWIHYDISLILEVAFNTAWQKPFIMKCINTITSITSVWAYRIQYAWGGVMYSVITKAEGNSLSETLPSNELQAIVMKTFK